MSVNEGLIACDAGVGSHLLLLATSRTYTECCPLLNDAKVLPHHTQVDCNIYIQQRLLTNINVLLAIECGLAGSVLCMYVCKSLIHMTIARVQYNTGTIK